MKRGEKREILKVAWKPNRLKELQVYTVHSIDFHILFLLSSIPFFSVEYRSNTERLRPWDFGASVRFSFFIISYHCYYKLYIPRL